MYGNRGDMQRQTAVTVYFSSEQLLLFVFAAHACILCWCWVSRFEFVSIKTGGSKCHSCDLWPHRSVTRHLWTLTCDTPSDNRRGSVVTGAWPPTGSSRTRHDMDPGEGGDTPCHTRVWPALLPPRGFPLTLSVRGSSSVCRRHILTSKVSPRTVRVNYF